MKKTKPWGVIFLGSLVLLAILSACQAKATIEEACQIDLETGEYSEGCFPLPGEDANETSAYPVAENTIAFDGDAGYPIQEDDLSLLWKTWRLISFAEDGVETQPPFKFLTFYDDGVYAVATESDLITGDWTTIFKAGWAGLVLNPGSAHEVQYQIVNLDEAELSLQTWQDAVQIDEGYEPDDSGCLCD